MRPLSCLTALTMITSASPFEKQGNFKDSGGESLSYLLIKPTTPPPSPQPLVVFLHGSGERGSDLGKIKKHGPPRQALTGEGLPFLVLAPQCPEGIWWNPDTVIALVRHIAREEEVDPDRIHLTGLSMGGYGTWSCLAKAPDLFASGVPICGGGDPDDAAILSNIPIWAFHGEDDQVVAVARTRQMEKAILAADGKKLRTTYYPGVGHDSWTRAYSDPALYAWMMLQRRTRQ